MERCSFFRSFHETDDLEREAEAPLFVILLVTFLEMFGA